MLLQPRLLSPRPTRLCCRQTRTIHHPLERSSHSVHCPSCLCGCISNMVGKCTLASSLMEVDEVFECEKRFKLLAVTFSTAVFRSLQSFRACETIKTVSQIDGLRCYRCFILFLLGSRAFEIERKIHKWIEGCCNVLALGTHDSTSHQTTEGAVNDAVAVFGLFLLLVFFKICGMKRVQDELQVFMGILLLVASQITASFPASLKHGYRTIAFCLFGAVKLGDYVIQGTRRACFSFAIEGTVTNGEVEGANEWVVNQRLEDNRHEACLTHT
ncbi:cysteine proteinase, partial [Aureobasidium melanogenum]